MLPLLHLSLILLSPGMIHHYLLTGKGPIQFLTGIPNYKSCIEPHLGALCK